MRFQETQHPKTQAFFKTQRLKLNTFFKTQGIGGSSTKISKTQYNGGFLTNF